MPISFTNLEDGTFKPQFCENPSCGRHLAITIRVHWHKDDRYSGDTDSPSKRYSCGKSACAGVVNALPFREPPRMPPPPDAKIVGEEVIR